jgi:Uma2 family endonuclease
MQLDTMLTLEEYSRLPPQEGHRLELSRGLLVRQPHPSALHATVTARIYDVLRDYAAHNGGRAVFGTAFVLQEEPPTIRGPDVALIAAPQPAERSSARVVRGAPLLAVEVAATLADGARAELLEKVFEYLDAGASAVWVVDLGSRSVASFENGSEPRIYRRTDTIEAVRALPGFHCPVAMLFG